MHENVTLGAEAALKYAAFRNLAVQLGEVKGESVSRPKSGELVLWLSLEGFATVAMIVPSGHWSESSRN